MKRAWRRLLQAFAGVLAIAALARPMVGLGAVMEPQKISAVTSIDDMRQRVMSYPDIECRPSAETHQLVCSSPSKQAIWVFTQPGHPAHPAFVVRQMVINKGLVGIDRSGEFAGSKPEYSRWFRAFDPLDDQQVKIWGAVLANAQSKGPVAAAK